MKINRIAILLVLGLVNIIKVSSNAKSFAGLYAPHNHITSHGEDGCRLHWPLYPRNNYLYKTLLLHK